MSDLAIKRKLRFVIPEIKSKVVFSFHLILLNAAWLTKTKKGITGYTTVVVSLATMQTRQKSLKRTLRSLILQKHSSFKIIIWVSNDDYAAISEALRGYLKYGIILRKAIPDFGSYNKFHHIAVEQQEIPIVTADDDIIYPRHWLKNLELTAFKYPGQIVGLRGICVAKNESNQILKYVDWDRAATSTSNELLVLNTGAGTFYPPKVFDDELIQDHEFLRISPTADDLWMFALAIQSQTKRRIADESIREIVPATLKQKVSLWKMNIGESRNDAQFIKILEYFPDVKASINAAP